MVNDNPFTMVFGREPKTLIDRPKNTMEIIDDFTSEVSSRQIYLLTGLRGSGKTVLMTDIAKRISESKQWIVINLNPSLSLLEGLAGALAADKEVTPWFSEAKLNFNLLGLGVELTANKTPNDVDLQTTIREMLKVIKAHGKRVLVTIDEVSKTENVKIFTSSFQIFVREELPLYLIMTGLYDEIFKLQNDKVLTFLYRAPKIYLESLDLIAVKHSYKRIFNLDSRTARSLADLTMGYPFAFQALGDLIWRNPTYLTDHEALLEDYDDLLAEYIYERLWFDLSELDKKVITMLSWYPNIKTIDIRQALNISPQQMNNYRKRLMRKGVINGDTHGVMKLELPRFAEFVQMMTEDDEIIE